MLPFPPRTLTHTNTSHQPPTNLPCSLASQTVSSFSTSSVPPLLDPTNPDNNVTPNIASRVGTNLHLIPNHPLNIIKSIIENHLSSGPMGPSVQTFDMLPPVVPVSSCFDSLLIPPGHVSRSPSDTYYLSPTHCLRTHTSAHQSDLIRSGASSFLCTGDVYRRDEIDRTHYPVFHQMEGVLLFPPGAAVSDVESHLRGTLEGLAKELFGDVETRWVDAYFPFTEPSAELEIFYGGEWLEVLGCGVVRREILEEAGVERDRKGWAFGLGLERLAMVLFNIPDIRLFWSKDPRFLDQFEGGGVKEVRDRPRPHVVPPPPTFPIARRTTISLRLTPIVTSAYCRSLSPSQNTRQSAGTCRTGRTATPSTRTT